MKITLIKPSCSQLQDHIECFYILERSPQDKPVSYLTFPSTFNIVVISRHTRTTESKQHLIIQHDPHTPLEAKLVANFNKPVLVQYQGAVTEITIYFKPIGLNAFIDEPLSTYQHGDYCDFKPFPDYEEVMQDVLEINNHSDKIKALEEYWLSKLKTFEHPFLHQMLRSMTDATISTLAAMFRVSRVTITKEFRKYLGFTPGHFKKIMRLRHSINEQKKQPGNRLTDISYALDYFDQSHMIRDFRTLTGMPPKKFFNDIAHIDPEYISWKFLSHSGR